MYIIILSACYIFLLISHLNIIWMYNATTHQWDTCICEYCMILTKWYKQERKESAIKFNDLYFSLCALSQWYFHNVYWMGGGGGRRKHIWSIKNEKKIHMVHALELNIPYVHPHWQKWACALRYKMGNCFWDQNSQNLTLQHSLIKCNKLRIID